MVWRSREWAARSCVALVVASTGVAAMPSPARAQPTGSQWLSPQVLVPGGSSSFDGDVLAAGSGADDSVAVWGDSTNLRASVRPMAARSFPSSTVIATNGSFWSNQQYRGPDAITAPNGDVLVAWSDGLTSGSVTLVTRPSGATAWTSQTVSSSGGLDVHVAEGADGTTAVVWNDASSVIAATRPAGSGTWGPPQVVESWAPGGVYPAVKDSRVGVDGGGNVTVAWGAEDGTYGTTTLNAWRVRAASLPSGATTWSTPTWVSPSGENESLLTLRSSTATGAAVAWFGQGTGGFTMEAAVGSGGTWSAPTALDTQATNNLALAQGSQGTFTAVWISSPSVRASTYTPGSGWAPATTIATPTDLNLGQVELTQGAGTSTAVWSGCPQTGSCVLRYNELQNGAWSSPTQIPGVDVGSPFSVGASSHGYLTVLYVGGDNALMATGMAPPAYTNTSPPVINGTSVVGDVVTANPGGWTPTPDSFSYQWNRQGTPIAGANGSSYQLPPAVGNSITVTVTAHGLGHLDTTLTSAPVTIASDTTAPAIEVTQAPPPVTADPDPTVTFTLSDPENQAGDLRALCSLDGSFPVTCTSPHQIAGLHDGQHTLWIRASDPSGNASSPVSLSWQVDTTPPTLTLAPVRTFTLGSVARWSWSGFDSASSVASYDLRYERAAYNTGFGSWIYPASLQHTGARTAALSLTLGSDYCTEVRARDGLGNLSAWSPARCTARPLDDRSLRTSTGWARATASGYFLSTYTATSALGRTLNRAGALIDRVSLVATICPTCGKVGVYVNGALVKIVNLYAARTHRQVLIPVSSFTYRSATVMIRSLSSRKTIQIDGLGLSRT